MDLFVHFIQEARAVARECAAFIVGIVWVLVGQGGMASFMDSLRGFRFWVDKRCLNQIGFRKGSPPVAPRIPVDLPLQLKEVESLVPFLLQN